MTALAESPLLGVQEPRICTAPDGIVSSLGPHAVAWARDVLGVELYPWQARALDLMLSQRADGKWAASRAAVLVPRQNGKSLLLMVRELYAILVLGDKQVVHSAHEQLSSGAAYHSTRDFLESAPGGGIDARKNGAIGREHLVFPNGGTLWFRTRTRTGGRGPSPALIVMDEAQELTDDQMQALLPSRGAHSMKGNPQLCYAGTAGNYASTVLARVRRAGIDRTDKRLLFLEHSIDDDAFLEADPDQRLAMLADPAQRALANPLYEILVSDEYLSDELTDLGAIGCSREHFGVGAWPLDDSVDWLIPRLKWARCADPESPPIVGAVTLAVGAGWDNTVSVAVCGVREDGMTYAELVDEPRLATAASIVDWVKRLRDEHGPNVIVIDVAGPVKFVVPHLEAAGIVLTKVTFQENAQACSGLLAAVNEDEPTFRHRGQSYVTAALAGARRKDIGDGWVLDRRRSSADVTPVEVLALARWGFVKFGSVESESWGFYE